MPNILVDEERCKGCGLCAHNCPKNVIQLSEKLNTKGYHPAGAVRPEDCTGCKICATICPDCAIEVYKEEK